MKKDTNLNEVIKVYKEAGDIVNKVEDIGQGLSLKEKNASRQRTMAKQYEKEQKDRVSKLKAFKDKFVKTIVENKNKIITGASIVTVLTAGFIYANGKAKPKYEQIKADSELVKDKDDDEQVPEEDPGEPDKEPEKDEQGNNQNNPKGGIYGGVNNPTDKLDASMESNGDVTKTTTGVTKKGMTEEEITTDSVAVDSNGNALTQEEAQQIKQEIQEVKQKEEAAVNDKSNNSKKIEEDITAVVKKEEPKPTAGDKGKPAIDPNQDATVIKSEEKSVTQNQTDSVVTKKEEQPKGKENKEEVVPENKSDIEEMNMDDFDIEL